MRVPLVAANWKMNLGKPTEALEFVRSIRHRLQEIEHVDIVLCPPFTSLFAVAEILSRSRITVGAQNSHWEPKGAFTGEISPAMLTEACRYAIVGHSERRAMRSEAESDAAVHRKVQALVANGLTPIVCVGENLQQNEAGQTQEVVGAQVSAAFEGLSPDSVAGCVIAYEPIWAIGTGKAASPVDANRIINLAIRGVLAGAFGEATAQKVRILYGGSATADNMASFAEMPEIDGALVGGASLKPEFVKLVEEVARVRGK
ncbi:MAG TPA: triose-phosphate isomerase [Anaerolineales bacterium]|nr:triose-phosphate isomerase [Anaerolineales bacterium]